MDDLLNGVERRVIDCLGLAWNEYLKLTELHSADAKEMCLAIHAAQNIVMARPVQRQFNLEPDIPPEEAPTYEGMMRLMNDLHDSFQVDQLWKPKTMPDMAAVVDFIHAYDLPQYIAVKTKKIIRDYCRDIGDQEPLLVANMSDYSRFLGIDVRCYPGLPENIVALIPSDWNGDMKDVPVLIIEEAGK